MVTTVATNNVGLEGGLEKDTSITQFPESGFINNENVFRPVRIQTDGSFLHV